MFDAISYCKGACVVKMLNAVLGMDMFKKGLQVMNDTAWHDIPCWTDRTPFLTCCCCCCCCCQSFRIVSRDKATSVFVPTSLVARLGTTVRYVGPCETSPSAPCLLLLRRARGSTASATRRCHDTSRPILFNLFPSSAAAAAAAAAASQEYMKKHKYGNTETYNLWDAWSKVSGKDIGEVTSKHKW